MIPETLPKVKFINIYITEISLLKLVEQPNIFVNQYHFVQALHKQLLFHLELEKNIESSNPEKFLKVTFVFLEGFKVLDNSVTDGQEVSNVLGRHPVV